MYIWVFEQKHYMECTTLKRVYERLRTAGQGAKVALTACRRQRLTSLKAMVKHQKPWQAQEVPSA